MAPFSFTVVFSVAPTFLELNVKLEAFPLMGDPSWGAHTCLEYCVLKKDIHVVYMSRVTCVFSPVNSRHPNIARGVGVSTGVPKGLMLCLREGPNMHKYYYIATIKTSHTPKNTQLSHTINKQRRVHWSWMQPKRASRTSVNTTHVNMCTHERANTCWHHGTACTVRPR